MDILILKNISLVSYQVKILKLNMSGIRVSTIKRWSHLVSGCHCWHGSRFVGRGSSWTPASTDSSTFLLVSPPDHPGSNRDSWHSQVWQLSLALSVLGHGSPHIREWNIRALDISLSVRAGSSADSEITISWLDILQSYTQSPIIWANCVVCDVADGDVADVSSLISPYHNN